MTCNKIGENDHLDTDINIQELASMLAAKRGKRSLRSVAEEIGDVSISTLSRVEQGKIPDLGTYMKICRWLDVPAERFSNLQQSPTHSGATGAEFITAHLRADRTLAPETAEALSTMIRIAYEAASQGLIGKKQKNAES